MTLVHLLEATGRIQNLPELETRQSLGSLRHLRPKSFWVLYGLFGLFGLFHPIGVFQIPLHRFSQTCF